MPGEKNGALQIGAIKKSELGKKEQREIDRAKFEIDQIKGSELKNLSEKQIIAEMEGLRSAEITTIKKLEGGTSKTFWARLEDETKVFIKIIDLENEKYKLNIKELHPADTELSAYLIDRILGFDMVPKTATKDDLSQDDPNNKVEEIDSTIGEDDRVVIQKFVVGKTGDEMTAEMQLIPDDLILKLSIFDYIIANFDRSPSNYIFSPKSRKLRAPDNEFSFEDWGFDNIINDLKSAASESVITSEIYDIFENFKSNRSEIVSLITKHLEKLMTVAHIEACISRIEQISDIISPGEKISVENIDKLRFK